MGTFTLQEVSAGREASLRDAPECAMQMRGEGAARAERWLELGDGGAARFEAIARKLAGNIGDDHDPQAWAQIGGFWHLAGDPDAARPWLQRVTRERDWGVPARMRSGALYLLGNYREAADTDDSLESRLAEVARSGDTRLLVGIRERLVELALFQSDGPHDESGGDPLTPWDWVEESFLLESRLVGTPVPSHLEMLQRCGALRAGLTPAVPAPLSPEVGLFRSDLHGGWLRVTEKDEVVVRVAAELFVVLRRQFDLWGAQVTDDPEEPGEWVTEPEYPDWRHAATATAQWVKASRRPESEAARQAATITELVIAAGGDAGEAVPKPRERVGPPPEIQYPTIEFNDGDIIDIELADDLILQFRTPLEAPQWYGRVAFEPLALMDDVVPPPHPTWQDAARQMMVWLTEHHNGRGVAELKQLLRELDER